MPPSHHIFLLHGAVSEPRRLHKFVVAFRNLCPKGKSTNIRCTGVSSLPVRRLFVQALRGARFFEKVAHGRMGSRYFPLPAFCTLGRLPRASVDRRLPSERVLRGKRAVSGALHLPHDAQGLRPRSSVVVRYRRRREVGQRAASASRGTGMQPAHPGRRNSAVIYDNLYSWGRLQAEKPELRANAMTKGAA